MVIGKGCEETAEFEEGARAFIDVEKRRGARARALPEVEGR